MWNREQLSSCSDHLAQSRYLPPRLPRMHPCSTWPRHWDDRAGRGGELGGIHFRNPTSSCVYLRDCMDGRGREMWWARQLHYKWRQNSWQCEGCRVQKRALQEQVLEYWFRDSGYDPPNRPRAVHCKEGGARDDVVQHMLCMLWRWIALHFGDTIDRDA